MHVPLLVLGALAFGASESPDPVDRAEFKKLFAKLVPKDVGRWQTIPWQTDLGKARELAVHERRPLFMWSMNGHPLGCT